MGYLSQSEPDFSNLVAAPMPWEMNETEVSMLLAGGENASLLLLGVSILCVAVISTLEKAGVRKIEDLPLHNLAFKVLAIFSIPLVLITEVGMIAVAVWAVFVLNWLKVLAVIVGTIFIGGMAWGGVLYALRRSSHFECVARAGAPLILALRCLASFCLGVLAYRLVSI